MKRIKVAFFAEILIEDFDGASRTMFQLLRRADLNQFEFLFICGTGPDELLGAECIHLPTLTLPINTSYSMALPGLAGNELKKKLDAFAPEVIHIATPSLLGGFALKYATKWNLPVITIYHTHFISYIDYYLKHTPFLIDGVKRLVSGSQMQFYNQCHKIYVPAKGMIAQLNSIGVERSRMTLWKRGINTRLFSPSRRNPEAMERLTGNQGPTILFASRLVWEKNLETLFRIYEQMEKARPDVTFVIAGDGIAAKACRSRMKKAVFTGKVDHETLSTLYASASVFLFPSISETYGNVVLEAMASGLPCVIADGGGSADFIDDGINGFKCKPCDAEEYVEKIKQLLEDPELAARFAHQSLQLSQQVSWEQLAAQYYEDLHLLARQTVLISV